MPSKKTKTEGTKRKTGVQISELGETGGQTPSLPHFDELGLEAPTHTHQPPQQPNIEKQPICFLFLGLKWPARTWWRYNWEYNWSNIYYVASVSPT